MQAAYNYIVGGEINRKLRNRQPKFCPCHMER